jgi:radical SAM superfamily enzyme YgiQ (UPF0313 family)
MLRSGVRERRLRVTLVAASVRREEELPGFEHVRDFASESYNLAIGSLAAAVAAEPDLAAAVSLELLDLDITWDRKHLPSDAADAVLATDPDVLGLSCYCWSVDTLLDLARRVRAARPGVLVVLGGPSAGPVAAELLVGHTEVDAVVLGEGECTFVALLRALWRDEGLGLVPGLATRVPGGAIVEAPEPPPLELAKLRSPYLDGTLAPKGSSILLETSRGCRFRCRFCSWMGGGRTLRYRPIEAIEADLAWAKDHGLDTVKLTDTAINFHDDRLDALTAAVRRVDPSRLRLTYFLKQELLTRRQAELLARVPAEEVIIGVESLVPAVRRAIGKPPLALRELEDKLELLSGVGPVTLSLILGLPHDTVDGLVSSLEQVLEIHARHPGWIHVICLFWLAVLPGSRLHRDRSALGYRLLEGETPYLLESREHSPDDLLAMARASAELHYRNPTLRVEYFHKEALAQDAPRHERRGTIRRRVVDGRRRAVLLGWRHPELGPGSGRSGHLEIARIAAFAEADGEVRRAWRLELVVPERHGALGAREVDDLVDLDPELILVWAGPGELVDVALRTLRSTLPRARLLLVCRAELEQSASDIVLSGAAGPRFLTLLRSEIGLGGSSEPATSAPSPYQWGMVHEPGDTVFLELADGSRAHAPDRVFGDVRWAIEQRYRHICWIDPEVPRDPDVRRGLLDAIRRADPGSLIEHHFVQAAELGSQSAITKSKASPRPQVDALFVHVPLFRDGRREIMVLPLGVPALANMLADEGRCVAVTHLGIESEIARRRGSGGSSEKFSLRALLEELRPRLVLLSLHWNQQTGPVIDVAQRIAGWSPECKVVLGGLTASVFARDLVGSLPFVAAVVRGDGEEPLRTLARAWIDGDGDIEGVPNAVWRTGGGEVRENPVTWVLDEPLSATLRHGDISLLRHHEEYLSRSLYADFDEGEKGSEGYPYAAYLNAGRGCPRSCPCCGGAADGQWTTSKRTGVLLYPLEKVLRDTREAVSLGARVLRTSFEPPGDTQHLVRWFEALRAEGHRLRLVHDLWELPTRDFLAVIARCFDPGSTVVFSPECGSERVRGLIRPPGWSNDELVDAVREAEALGLETHCFFSAGLPGETPDDVALTARLIERLRASTRTGISVVPMFVDPASPLWHAPERYGVRLVRKTLADFHDRRGVPGGPGYETENFDERGILEQCDRLRAAAGLRTLPGV